MLHVTRSKTKGVMVPPVCVDMNSDGVKDILMLAFDGRITLYDGETLQERWTIVFVGYECYRCEYNFIHNIVFVLSKF